MNHRAEYLLQVLEKIGTPLLASVIDAGAPAQHVVEAQKIAELLAKTVQTGIDMGYALDLGPTGEVTDSVRLALAGVAAPLIAGSFRNSGKAPGDAEVKKIVTALQAVLTFAENFAADSDNADRLKNLTPGAPAPDAAQTHAQYIYALVPVVNAIAAFSFGLPEQKLVLDVAGRLAGEAPRFRQSLMGDAGPDNHRADLGVLSALAALYAASHQAETARITAAAQPDAATPGMDAVWRGYEIRAAMLETLVHGILPASGAAGTSGGPQPGAAPPQQPSQPQAAPIAPSACATRPPGRAAGAATATGREPDVLFQRAAPRKRVTSTF
jgi:hypothetical protein